MTTRPKAARVAKIVLFDQMAPNKRLTGKSIIKRAIISMVVLGLMVKD